MRTKAFAALGAACMLAAVPAQAQQTQAQQSVTSAFNLRIGGFVQMNTTWDSDENNDDNPSQLRQVAVVPGSIQDGQSTVRWAATRARMFFDARGTDLWGAKTRAYTEFDWDGLKLNDDGETSATAAHTPRLRRSYMRFDWPSSYLLIGQERLLFFDAVGSAAGAFIEGVSSGRGGMTGGSRNRAPAFIFASTFPMGGAALELTGSVARHATDRNPTPDDAGGINDTGTRSRRPALQTMAKLTTPLFNRETLIAASTYWGEETLRSGTTAANRVTQDVNSRGYGLQGALPLGPVMPGLGAFELRASVFRAENMARWNLGLNGLTSNSPGANTREIGAKGGWAELNWQITQKYALIAGGGVNKDDRPDVLAMGGTTARNLDNRGVWLFATWRDGPWSSLLGFSKVQTERIVPSTEATTDSDSRSVHLVFRYSF